MNQLLTVGQTVWTESAALPCVVVQFLGGGGQGEVYRAELGGQDVALKWYFPQTATRGQEMALSALAARGAPNDRFLWPLDLAHAPGVPGFGYVMPLRESRFRGLAEVMSRRVEPTFHALATAGLELAHGFLQLHARGLCYRDISFGNVFLDPETGEVRICDNDNVGVDGASEGGILGTPRFMAPEVVRGEARPGTQTDLFSLSVLLFYLMMMHHPLEGKREAAIRCFDLPAMTRLYGTDPLFIFDPLDSSNAPIPGHQDNALAFWPLYPPFLRDLFLQSFTRALRDPLARVRESEWRAALSCLRDLIFPCAHCGAENFADVFPDGPAPVLEACWSCHGPLVLPMHIRIGRNTILLNHDSVLFPHHTDPHRAYDFSAPVAAVTRHPSNPNLWGLKNLSADTWTLTTPEGVARDVPPDRSGTLAPGARIHFGDAEGVIGH